MQKIRTCLQKTPNALFCVLGAVVFLAGFYFLCYRTPLNEVWLPTTMNNDEALYNRQVVSVLTHGGPQGYFGYQESTADIGRYGTWGPLLIWAYALPGLLFGASVNVVLWCNLLLIAVGIAVFARCARLNYWQCIALCGALFSIMLPLRSCVSGASEAMHYMLALLIVGTAAALHRSGKTGWLIACAAACAVETIFRPYALLFWVFPLTAVWQNKRRRAACLGTAAGGFAVSLFAMAKLAAPYFSDGGMDFDGIRLLLQLHPVAAVRYECARAAALLHAAWRDDILPTLHGETTYIGGGCVTFLAVVLVAVVCLVWDKHKGRPLVLKGCALFCSAVIALVLLFMFTYLPFFKMVEFSFFKMKYIGRRTFVGLQNYISVFTRKDCFHALSLSLYYMVGSVVQMALALLFATILSFKGKGSKFFRGALSFPCLICGISVGFIFKFFFTHGFVLDTLLSWVGFNVDKLPFWLRDESINNVVLVACSIWKYIGQNIVMFIGAIASVDPVLYEAAEIDGANAWHRFKDIILPSISTIVVLNLIISVSGALSAFEMPYVVTGGGFNTVVTVQQGTAIDAPVAKIGDVVMDKIAHTDQKVGLASAMAVVLLLLIVIVTYAQKAVEKWLENRSSGVTK